jgi:hypothetical protein
MLYLPGLQNVVAEFFSCLSSLPKLTENVASIAATTPIDIKEMVAKQNPCPET